MPRIREYENPIRGLDVSNAGASAIARAGEFAGNTLARERIGPAIARFGDATADTYERLVVQPELNKGAALFAQYQDELTRKWNETAAKSDPNDRTIKAKFEESELEPALEKFRAGFNTGEGQKFADKQIAAFRTHMMQKTTADMSTRAAAAATKNFDTMTNSLTNMVMNDPSSFDHAIANAKANVEAITKNTPDLDVRTQAALSVQLTKQLQSEVAKAWLIGTARVNPDAAQAAIENGKLSPYINAVEAKQMINYAQSQARAIRQDEELSRVRQERELKARSDAREQDFLKLLYPENGKSQITTTQVVNDPDLNREAKERLAGLIRRELKPETDAQISKQTATDLFARIYLPENDPNRISDVTAINQAMIDGKLNRTDFEWLRKEVTNLRTPEGQRLGDMKKELFNRYGALIDQSVFGKLDPTGKVQMYGYHVFVEQKIEQYRKEGKNPFDLFNPKSPDFLGAPEVIERFRSPINDRIQAIVRQIDAGTLPSATTNLPKPEQDRLTARPVPAEVKAKYPDAQWDGDRLFIIRDGKKLELRIK